ncbi:hypothetical protein UFOVP219_20 [uncultured Caudovirales phage]|uniref:Uncharacterized protein n=1 Tax=uncultured Caudovirales phage TaxID=2100421 RepID=A0A6J7WK65_9CAUD|nr:hypothetical protein UFOVP219_20 [uncultured Caudovirales phage]
MAVHKTVCRHCGFVWSVAAESKDRSDLLCKSCRAKPAKVIQYGVLRCEPHSGGFDQDDNPVDDVGNLVFEGERVCGHRDCVNPKHVG